MTDKLVTGKSAAAEIIVDETNTAGAVGSGSLPVFATPTMAALMEKAACYALADCLDEGETSVGTELAIKHVAATPCGAKVTATAEITAVNGREIKFNVTARDNAGAIGMGTHTRFIVKTDKFMEKASGRI